MSEQTSPTSTSKFDPAKLRLSQNFAEASGVKKLITTVPVRKPNKQDFVRVHPSKDYQIEAMILETQDEHEAYLVLPEVYEHLPEGVAVAKVLRLAITRQGVILLWPIKLPDQDGRLDNWNASAHIAAELAEKQWLRIVAKRALGAYEPFVATATENFPEPEWPDLSFQKILEIAFMSRLIETPDHIILRKLWGKV